MSYKVIIIKIKHRAFACTPLVQGEVNTYRAIDKNDGGLYYVADNGCDYAYSKTREKAVQNLKFLNMIKKFESKPINFEETMDLDCFVFYYRSEAFACADVKANLSTDIAKRNIRPQSEYTFQQLLCFAVHRHNFEYFKLHILDRFQTDKIHTHHDCKFCKERFNIKCGTEWLGNSR
jgi:hypothetical protein